MDSVFEPMSFLDPSFESTFLSFSSFADFDIDLNASTGASVNKPNQPSSCSSLSTNNFHSFNVSPTSQSTSSFGESAYTAEDVFLNSVDPFEIVNTAFDSATEHEYGIFHTAGPSKLSRADAASVSGSSPTRPGSSEYDSPLVTPAAKDNHTFTSPDIFRGGFSWDDAPLSLASSSSSGNYLPVKTVATTPTPLRVASNPVLGSSSASTSTSRQFAVKPVMSMPALKEEDAMSWLNMPEEPLVDDNFDWVFNDLGLDGSTLDGTIFAAFKEGEQQQDWTDNSLSMTLPVQTPTPMSSGDAGISAPLAVQMPYQVSTPMTMPMTMPVQMPEMSQSQSQTTFDPFAMVSVDVRPSTAPSMEGMDGLGFLSAPENMTRSYTAPSYPRSAPPADIFYQPPSSTFVSTVPPPAQRPLSQRRASTQLTVNVNAPNHSTYSSSSSYSPVFPPTPQSAIFPSHSQITFQPAPPMSGPSGAPVPAHLLRAQAIVQMQEAREEAQRQELRRQAEARRLPMSQASVMQPLEPTPTSRPAIVGWEGPPAHGFTTHPPQHGQGSVAQVSAPVQMPQQQLQAHQQPQFHPPPPHHSAPTYSHSHLHARAHTHPAPGPILTTQPLIVHPPQGPSSMTGYSTYQPPPQHRVHPPPQPISTPTMSAVAGPSHQQQQQQHQHQQTTATGRPMARLPSPRSRKVSSPTKRSPSGRKRGPMQPGQFSWGEATFINFTSDDAEKLLTGVAPSGSQSKRKREEEAARLAAAGSGCGAMNMNMNMNMGMGAGLGVGVRVGYDMEREGSKRSRTSE